MSASVPEGVRDASIERKAPDHLPWRRGIARVLYSPAGRFRTIVFQAGQTRRVGRDERSDVRIADPALRGAHLEIYFDGLRFHAKALSADAAIAIDGKPAQFGEIQSGGFVVAGATTLALHVERRTPAPEATDAPFGAERARLVSEVVAALAPSRETWSLYGVLDAARDPRVRVLLAEGIDEHASLYEGAEGAILDEVAPYLVRFAPDSKLLERLVTEGWGRAWGVFAQSAMGSKDVRRHFRRFLMVKDETTDERMFFRFYDPRVFPEFFSVATPRQQSELLEGLSSMSMETEAGHVLRLASSSVEPASSMDA